MSAPRPTTPESPTPRATPASLTDRYVSVAMRGVAPDARADLELELRGLIDDSIDARLEAGDVDRSTAEVAALTELGDPARLAERYRGRPTHLIGPAFFHQWWGLLRLLLTIVVPIVALLAGIAEGIDGGAVGEVVSATLVAALMVAVQVSFWTTAVFAVIERVAPDAVSDDHEWTPDDLPEVATGSISLGDIAMTVVVSAITIAAMFWQRGSTLVTDDGAPVPILEPDNWSFWWPFLIALLVAEAAFAVAAFRRGRWTLASFVPYAAVQLVLTAAVLWLLSQDRFLNPEFVAQLNWSDVGDAGSILSGLIAAGVVVTTLWDIGDTYLGMRRAARGEPVSRSGACVR